MPPTPPPGFGDPSCAHRERDSGVCKRCGHCDHELILNGACYFCGTTELDPIALSPKKPSVIPADALVRRKPRPRVVAISGKRFFGKDTLAAAMVAHASSQGRELSVHAFANESKRMFAASRPGIDLARLLTDRVYKEGLRPQLTQFTVDAIAADPLVFCRSVADRITAAGAPALISDLRLRLEHAHLREHFALHVVRLARSDASRAASGWRFVPGVDDHATETELDDPALWDEVVDNDGTLHELAARAAAIVGTRL